MWALRPGAAIIHDSVFGPKLFYANPIGLLPRECRRRFSNADGFYRTRKFRPRLYSINRNRLSESKFPSSIDSSTSREAILISNLTESIKRNPVFRKRSSVDIARRIYKLFVKSESPTSFQVFPSECAEINFEQGEDPDLNRDEPGRTFCHLRDTREGKS